MKSGGKLFHCTRVDHLAWISSLFFAFTIPIRCKNAARTAACVSPEMLACLLMRLNRDSFVDSLFRSRPWGMWLQGEERCLQKSLTVLLFTSKMMRKRGEGKKCHPCLNFVVCGKYSDCCHHLNHAFNLPHRSCL